MDPVEIFKTNVVEDGQASQLTRYLLLHFPEYKINFDLSDCDKILRVQGNMISPEKIAELVRENGYECDLL